VRAAAFIGEGRENTGGDLVTTATMSYSYYLDYNKKSMITKVKKMFLRRVKVYKKKKRDNLP
jgi:hypothetical protein